MVLQEHQMVIMCVGYEVDPQSTETYNGSQQPLIYSLLRYIHCMFIQTSNILRSIYSRKRGGGKKCLPRNVPTVLETPENRRRNKYSKLVSVCKLRQKQIVAHASWY